MKIKTRIREIKYADGVKNYYIEYKFRWYLPWAFVGIGQDGEFKMLFRTIEEAKVVEKDKIKEFLEGHIIHDKVVK